MSDISEWATVDKSRVIFKRLNKVRFQSVFQQSSHSTATAYILSINRLSVSCVSNEYLLNSSLKVSQIGSEAKNSHYLRSDSYLERILSRNTIHL